MKKILLAAAAAIVSLSASAISPFVEFQPIQVGDDQVFFNVSAGIQQKINHGIAVGAGIGVTEKWNFNVDPLIPIFVRGEYSTPMGKFLPYVSFDLGYEINTGNTNNGAVLVNPMIGLKFGHWYGGLGYLGHCWTAKKAGTTNTFNIKIGYTF